MKLQDKLLAAARKTGAVDPGDLEDVLEICAKKLAVSDNPAELDSMMLAEGTFTEDQILRLFAAAFGLEYIEHIDPADVPVEFSHAVPSNYAHQHNVCAIENKAGTLIVATCRPLEFYAVDNIANMTRMPVIPALANRAIINTAINGAYEQRTTVLEDVADEIDSSNIQSLIGEVSSEDLLDVVNRPPVIRLVNDILFKALQMRTSDVHIHPFEQKLMVRYRIDGLLYDMLTLDPRMLPVLVSRIKVMSGMDIAERRMPQDGRCSVRIGSREVDLRVSTVPTAYGERSVLRILDKGSGVYSLKELGLSDYDYNRIDDLINRPHGVFFVTGPTGSGKSTTLYSFLQRIDAREKNVITVEDPIEYHLDGISQIQVANRKGMTFITALRHILRQDPDVIMVGEVRDEETARMVIQSSLTGHLVFSTLHTNDASGAITRIMDFNVEPYLVASSVAGALAQRLVRRLCPHCKEEIAGDSDKIKKLGLAYSGFEKVYEPRGCDKCFKTGYMGRTGIYELMAVDDDIRQCIYQRKSAAMIKKVALEGGMTTLRMDGMRKVEQGLTSLEEILRMAQSDEV